MTPPLADDVKGRIGAAGPLPLDAFMGLAAEAYYRRARVFGASGDFITAPEISQVFGELVGLWCALRWLADGSPSRAILAECGPGRGTLIADALRATRAVPGFHAAIALHLIETSPTLRSLQAEALGGFPARWHDRLADLPTDAPIYLVANEFLDALPIRQFVRRGAAWRERQVGLDGDRLVLVDGPDASPPPDLLADLPDPVDGGILEHRPAADAFARDLATRLVAQGGAALILDYGPAHSGYGGSLQAVARHAYADPLAEPGEADLTAHLDFGRLAAVARSAGLAAFGPAHQGHWLLAMGVRERTAQLAANATPAQAALLASGAARLCETPAMGRLFKVLALLPGRPETPEGF
jgi:NADH dehydrogenase [ubiquinone] 1 alpha subcomplex assembly factor 7